MTSLKLTGVDETIKGLAKATKAHADALDAAMFVVAGDILTELLPGVPFKRGVLRASRWVPRTAPTAIEFSADHAAHAHELGLHRKYLQRPVSEAASSVPARLAALVPKFAEAGTTLALAPSKHPTQPAGGAGARRQRPQAPSRRR